MNFRSSRIVIWTVVLFAAHMVWAASNPLLWGKNGVVVHQPLDLKWSGLNIPSDSGGMFVVWQDDRAGSLDLYAQFVTAEGRALWADSGMAVVRSKGTQSALGAIAVEGGWIVAWSENQSSRRNPMEFQGEGDYEGDAPATKHPMHTNGLLRAQKLNPRGERLWKANDLAGIDLSNGQWYREQPLQLVDDGKGGMIAVWIESHGDSMRVMANRVTAQGKIVWPQPINVSGNWVASDASIAAVASDSGSVLMVWSMNDGFSLTAFRAARISADGVLAWGTGGKDVPWPNTVNKLSLQAVSDGAGGCMIAATTTLPPKVDSLPKTVEHSAAKKRAPRPMKGDPFSASRGPARLQRISGAGLPLWGNAWITPTSVPSARGEHLAVSRQVSGIDGCLLLWDQTKDYDRIGRITAQKIGIDGKLLWDSLGITLAVCADSGEKAVHLIQAENITSDNKGGALIQWQKIDQNKPSYRERFKERAIDHRLSRISASGRQLWGADGVSIPVADEQATLAIAPQNTSVLGIYCDADGWTKSLRTMRINPDDGANLLPGKNNFAFLANDGYIGEPKAVSLSEDRVALVWRQRENENDIGLSYNVLNAKGQLKNHGASKPLMEYDQASNNYAAQLQVCPDGTGGLFAALPYNRPGTNELRVRRLTAEGVPYGELDDGMATSYLCNPPRGFSAVSLAPSGKGYCFAAVLDASSDREYPNLVRITRLNETQGTCSGWGEAIAVRTNNQMRFEGMTGAGENSVLEVWQETEPIEKFKPGFKCSLHAAWITANNAGLWFKTICEGWQSYKPFMVSDNHKGGYVVWQANRSEEPATEIFAQHLDSSGVFLWGENGILLSDTAADKSLPELVNVTSDSLGNLFVLMNSAHQLRLVKIDIKGEMVWSPQGIYVADQYTDPRVIASSKAAPHSKNAEKKVAARKEAPEKFSAPMKKPRLKFGGKSGSGGLVADGTGGCFAAWMQGDKRLVGSHEDRNGHTLFSSVALSENGIGELCSSVRTMAGDFVVVWTERAGDSGQTIKAQRIRNVAAKHSSKKP